jgi:hypothetical protein
MKWSEKNLHPSLRTLRQFGGLSVIFFSYGAFVQGYLRHQTNLAVVFAGLAATIGLLALIKPSFIRPIYVGAMVITFPIGWVVSRVLLGLIYYGLITPIALVFRLIGRDALSLKHQSETKTTYWLPKVISTDPQRYFRMY